MLPLNDGKYNRPRAVVFLLRLFGFLFRLAACAVILVAVFLLLAQHRMIYFPRHYEAGTVNTLKTVESLAYSTSQGRQQSYYVPPRSGTAWQLPSRIWVTFSGNGGLALDWLDFVRAYPAAHEAFLLMDYPGYGSCAGKPSSKTIEESADAALAALASRLGVSVAELEPRLGVLGHSLGAASALGFASAHPVARVVLLAPFTTLRDMARRSVGWPLCYLLLDNFDNRARLQEIARRASPPPVEILSGVEDELIPFAMGEQLAQNCGSNSNPGQGAFAVHFQTVASAGHNDIISVGEPQIFAAMAALPRFAPIPSGHFSPR